MCCMVTQIRHLGVSGARWSSGRNGWIVFCVHLSYFNLEYLSHLIFILIPLWRGFYFSEDMLSDVHTVDVGLHKDASKITFWLTPANRVSAESSWWKKEACWGILAPLCRNEGDKAKGKEYGTYISANYSSSRFSDKFSEWCLCPGGAYAPWSTVERYLERIRLSKQREEIHL
jgi:hypothetical protein